MSKFAIRQDGKIYNEKTNRVALQPVLWMKKAFGGNQSKANFHEFMNLKNQIEKKAADAPPHSTEFYAPCIAHTCRIRRAEEQNVSRR